MIASHTITYQHADGRERTLTLYSNERIASGLAARLVAAQGSSAVQSPPHQEVVVNENLLSTSEVAAILGITRRRVLALIKAGRLPAQRIGDSWIIRRQDLELVKDRKRGRPRLQK